MTIIPVQGLLNQIVAAAAPKPREPLTRRSVNTGPTVSFRGASNGLLCDEFALSDPGDANQPQSYAYRFLK